jgi:hypothetical protein
MVQYSQRHGKFGTAGNPRIVQSHTDLSGSRIRQVPHLRHIKDGRQPVRRPPRRGQNKSLEWHAWGAFGTLEYIVIKQEHEFCGKPIRIFGVIRKGMVRPMLFHPQTFAASNKIRSQLTFPLILSQFCKLSSWLVTLD